MRRRHCSHHLDFRCHNFGWGGIGDIVIRRSGNGSCSCSLDVVSSRPVRETGRKSSKSGELPAVRFPPPPLISSRNHLALISGGFVGCSWTARPVLPPDTPPIDAILPLDGEARWFPVSGRRAGDVSHIGGLQSFVDTWFFAGPCRVLPGGRDSDHRDIALARRGHATRLRASRRAAEW